MTYCIAVKLKEHLVFASDSRTNAGPDHVNTYKKTFRWGLPGESQFVLLSAGNLATTQSVVTQIDRDIKENAAENLHNMRYLSDAADYIGQLSLQEQARHRDSPMSAGFNASSTFILGGQVGDEEAEILLIYPEGNHIKCPDGTPFLQIGETKYGKPILDRIIRDNTSIEDTIRCLVVSMDSTMRSNVTVGLPIDLCTYQSDSMRSPCCMVFDEDNPYLLELRTSWGESLVKAFAELPDLPFDKYAPCHVLKAESE